MATQATGSNGAADGHQQSIGADSPTPVDGIAGSHPGTQEPSGAHVDAGGPVGGPGERMDDSKPQDKGVRTPVGSPSGGIAGMNGDGVAQPKGMTGMLGMGRGKMVGVYASSGSLSRQHATRQ